MPLLFTFSTFYFDSSTCIYNHSHRTRATYSLTRHIGSLIPLGHLELPRALIQLQPHPHLLKLLIVHGGAQLQLADRLLQGGGGKEQRSRQQVADVRWQAEPRQQAAVSRPPPAPAVARHEARCTPAQQPVAGSGRIPRGTPTCARGLPSQRLRTPHSAHSRASGDSRSSWHCASTSSTPPSPCTSPCRQATMSRAG